MRPLAGLFVGGKSTRMGSPKGLLAGPHGVPLVRHLIDIARPLCSEVVLVGAGDVYGNACPDVRALADAPNIEGPLAGLRALLAFANGQMAIALACDLPFLEAALLQRLVVLESDAAIVAPRASCGAPWEPLLARYDSARALASLDAALQRGVRSFQKWFATLRVAELPIEPGERPQLRDWDTPDETVLSKNR